MPVNFAPAFAARAALIHLLNTRDCHATLKAKCVEFALQFRDDIPISRGQEVPYTVRITTGRGAYQGRNALALITAESEPHGSDTPPEITEGASEPYVTIEIALPYWRELEDVDKCGLLDEALCQVHAGGGEKTGTTQLKLVPPDVRAWAMNVGAFPTWKDGLASVVQAYRDGQQLGLPLEEFGPMDAALSPALAKRILGEAEPGTRPVVEITGMGSIEPGDIAADGELRAVLTSSAPGTAEDAADQEVQRSLEDVAEELQTVDPRRFPPALTSEANGKRRANGRRKAPEEIATPDASGWRDHVNAKRGTATEGAPAA